MVFKGQISREEINRLEPEKGTPEWQRWNSELRIPKNDHDFQRISPLENKILELELETKKQVNILEKEQVQVREAIKMIHNFLEKNGEWSSGEQRNKSVSGILNVLS